ncbi:MAG: 2-oxoacid:acceptor oxidoreductase family protein, partial [Atopobiaceae bacterium]|nr:2-oxoacid:acceptor oxidoreductase family protein [Atopobiaceae bacterium]
MADFNHELLCVLSGFGGQGLLFAGKIMANCGLIDGRQVSWMPSYGPEMRGGTANCSVSLSDDAIGTPFITKPTALIAMNQPSVEKFAASVQPGGAIVVDTTLAMNGTEGVE